MSRQISCPRSKHLDTFWNYRNCAFTHQVRSILYKMGWKQTVIKVCVKILGTKFIGRWCFSIMFIRFLSFRYHMKALIISGNQSFILQLLNIVGPLREQFDFFIPLGFEIQSPFDHKVSKIKFCSGRAFIWYPKDKNLIHDGETRTILKFSAKNFDTDFRYIIQ